MDAKLPNSVSHHTAWVRFNRRLKRQDFDSQLAPWLDEDKHDFFRCWLDNNEDMEVCSLTYTRRIVNRKKSADVYGYKTYDDLMQMFHNKKDKVDELCKRKVCFATTF